MSVLTLLGRVHYVNGITTIIYRTTGGTTHCLPISSKCDFEEDSFVAFRGQLCTSFVVGDDGKRHKQHFGVGSIKLSQCPVYLNDLSVQSGRLVQIGQIRTTPLTLRKIVDFKVLDGANVYNCIAFGRTAQRLVDLYKVGDIISIYSARFQSRDYDKDGVKHTVYEVCVRNFG